MRTHIYETHAYLCLTAEPFPPERLIERRVDIGSRTQIYLYSNFTGELGDVDHL